jgi:hypothetical protein
MQPVFVQELPDEDIASEHPADIEEVDPGLYKAVAELKDGIFALKKKLFYSLVSMDNKHDASSLGAMMTFHSLFLQCVAYWIGLLDSSVVPKPKFTGPKQQKEFDTLSSAIHKTATSSADAHTLVYNLLFQFSTQHPFDLGPQENTESN